MICPRVLESKKEDGMFSRIKTYFFGKSTDETILGEKPDSVTDGNLMRKKCLEIYLQKELDMISTGNYQADINLEEFVQHMNCVYISLLSPYIHDGKRTTNMPKRWSCQPFQQVRHHFIRRLL